MRTGALRSLALLCLLLFALLLQISAQPVVTSVSPANGAPGSVVIITGSGFSTIAANNIVTFGSHRAEVQSASSTQIAAIVPAGAVYGQVRVSTGGLTGLWNRWFAPNQVLGNGTSLGSGSFVQGGQVASPGIAYWLNATDIDGDGRTDIVATYNDPGRLTVLTHTGTGNPLSFTQTYAINLPGNFCIVELADLNADGKPDIAVTANTANTLSVLLNQSQPGNTQFAPAITLPAGAAPFDVCAADLDNDGRTDLAVANSASTQVGVWLNRGAGGNLSFEAKNISAGIAATTLTAGDLNNDGRTDLAVASGNAIACLVNTGTVGAFSFAAPLPGPTGFNYQESSAADINADGWTDLVFSETGAFKVLLNNKSNGSPSFITRFYSGFAPFAVLANDFNFDGRPEILSNQYNSPAVNLLNIALDGNGSRFSYATPNPGRAVALGDFNLDGRCDIVSGADKGMLDLLFNAQLPVALWSFTPAAAGRGQQVSLAGGNLNLVTQVRFGGVQADSFRVVNPNLIYAYPGGGASGTVSVSTANNVTIELPGFNYLPSPVIKGFMPDTAIRGTKVTIRGANFNGIQEVRLGGYRVTHYLINDSTIEASIDTASSGFVTVVTSGGSDSLAGFTYIPSPRLHGFSHRAGPGDSLTLFGEFLIGVKHLTLGGLPLPGYRVMAFDSIRLKLPDYLTGGEFKVIARGGVDSLPGFSNGPDSITYSPHRGKPGDIVTITVHGAASLDPAQKPKVYFDNSPADVLSVDLHQVTVKVPSGTGRPVISLTMQGFSRAARVPFTNYFYPINQPLGATTFDPLTKLGQDSATQGSEVLYADLDGDGNTDIVHVHSSTSYGLHIYHNRSIPGGVRFERQVMSPPGGIAAQGRPLLADLNNDGMAELIYTGADNMARYYVNHSTPGSLEFAFGGSLALPTPWCAADMDNDGRMDLVGVAGSKAEIMYIALNTSVPQQVAFADPHYWSAAPAWSGQPFTITEILANDVNLDGKTDLLVQQKSYPAQPDGYVLYPNTSLPGLLRFGFESLSGGAQKCTLSNLQVADFDSDGYPDVGFSDCTTFPPVVYSNGYRVQQQVKTDNGTQLGATKLFSLPAYFSTTADDFDGDGRPDVASAESYDSIRLMRNTTLPADTISFALAASFGPPVFLDNSGAKRVEGIDLDSDGLLDLVVTSQYSATISFYRNSGGEPIPLTTCPNTGFTLQANVQANTYQWQTSIDGITYTSLSDNASYSGSATAQLTVSGLPSSSTGMLFRCLANGVAGKPWAVQFVNTFTGAVDSLWSNPLNWSCGVLPDAFTHAVVAANVEANIGANVGSLTIQSGARVSVQPGVQIIMDAHPR